VVIKKDEYIPERKSIEYIPILLPMLYSSAKGDGVKNVVTNRE